jgi:hypothetical protein
VTTRQLSLVHVRRIAELGSPTGDIEGVDLNLLQGDLVHAALMFRVSTQARAGTSAHRRRVELLLTTAQRLKTLCENPGI